MTAAQRARAEAERMQSSRIEEADSTLPVGFTVLDRDEVIAPPPSQLISVADALDQLERISKAPVYKTPFPTLNEALGVGGMLGGQVYDLCSGTGRGKTSMAGQIALHHRGDVLIAFYEAFAGYNVARMAAGPLGLHSNQIIRNAEKHRDAVLGVIPSRIHFLARPTLELLRIESDRIAQSSGTAPFLILDYMQKLGDLIQAGQQRPDARLAMSQASAGLLELAEKSGSPVLAVNAISRMNNRRSSQDPRKVAPYEFVDVAKESGAVEYDSAGMLVVSLSQDSDAQGRIATLTVAKSRYGQEQHIDMRFDGASGAWTDLGRVERETKDVLPPLRDAIRTALVKPAKNVTEIVRRTGRGRNDVLAEVRGMIADGEIDTDDGYSLVEDR